MKRFVVYLLIFCFIFQYSFYIVNAQTYLYENHTVNFENGQTYFATKYNGYSDETIVSCKIESGNSMMHISTMQTLREDVTWFDWNRNTLPAMFRLPDNDGTDYLYMKKGERYVVSFKIRQNKLPESFTYGELFSAFNVALVFEPSYNFSDPYLNSIPQYLSNNSTVITNKNIPLSDSGNWDTYTCSVLVPKDGYVAFLLYGIGGSKSWDMDIDVDDITFTKYSMNSENNINITEKEQSFFTNQKGYSDDAIISFSSAQEESCIKISTVQSYNTDISEFNWNYNVLPAMFLLPNITRQDKQYVKCNERYTVKVKLRVNETVTDFTGGAFSYMDAALVFSPNYNFNSTATNTLSQYISNGQTVVIAEDISIEKNADWRIFECSFTVPVSGYVSFAIYGKGGAKAVNTDISVKEITLSPFNEYPFADVNMDTVSDIRDLVAIKKMAADITVKSSTADLNDDSYLADSLDIAAVRNWLLSGKKTSGNTKKQGRTLVWSEEFNEPLNKEYWRTYSTSVSENKTFSNDSSTLYVENGMLHLIADTVDGKRTCSAGVTTKDKLTYQYGYLEIRARIPFGAGSVPCFWLLGNSNYYDVGWFQEIDVFEMYTSPTLLTTLHKWKPVSDGVYHEQSSILDNNPNRIYTFTNTDNLENEFHNYGFLWDEKCANFYVDDVLYYSVDLTSNSSIKGEIGMDGFKLPLYIILQNDYSYANDNYVNYRSDYAIDYVRLYQNQETESLYY